MFEANLQISSLYHSKVFFEKVNKREVKQFLLEVILKRRSMSKTNKTLNIPLQIKQLLFEIVKRIVKKCHLLRKRR